MRWSASALLRALALAGGLFACESELTTTAPDPEIPRVARTWDAIDFDLSAGEVPEGIAFDSEGRLYVGLAPLGKILRIGPDGMESTFATLLPTPIPAGGPPGLLGLAIIASGDVYAALVSFDPATHGVYRIDGRTTAFERLPGSAAICWPNALAFDHRGNLYVTESTRVCSGEPMVGAVWRISPGGRAEPWAESADLAGNGALGLGVPIGANGIAFRPGGGGPGRLIVANTETGALLSIPIHPDGTAGEVETLVQDQRLLPLDGIVPDVHGTIYAMVIGQNRIVKVSPDGLDLEDVADATNGLVLPVNAAFGTVGDDRRRLFVANFALPASVLPPGFPPSDPGIVVIDIGVPGSPLP
ncbi:MAG: SMP-30/gluconolactonase/LRE family protein [Gemmatimonadota bacterium]